jgi:hypothetical protein
MSVLIEAISVVIRNSTLEEKYPGGLRGYREDCPNRTFCADEHLSRVGFMVPDDVGNFVAKLERFGIVPFVDDVAFEVVVVDQMIGPTTECDWIEGGRYDEGYSAAWLVGAEPGALCAPEGWTAGQSQRMTLIPLDEMEERLLEVDDQEGLTTAIDMNTGREMFIARNHRNSTDENDV